MLAVGYLKTATGDFRAALWFLAGCALMAGLLATRLKPPRKNQSKSTSIRPIRVSRR